jgi:hypothetical protein
MIKILGVKFPVYDKILYPKKTDVVLSYISAIKSGKGEAAKNLKFLK